MRWRMRAGWLIAGACLASSGWAEQAGERFSNATAGISLVRPAGWHTASLQVVTENRARVQLADKEMQEAMQKQATAPLFVFTKYLEPHPNLNPSVQVTLRPLGTLAEAQADDILKTATLGLKRAAPDFAFVEDVHKAKVSGLQAAAMKATYTIKNADGQSFKVLSRMWIVTRGGYAFLIGMSGPQEGPDVSEQEFQSVLASLTIEP